MKLTDQQIRDSVSSRVLEAFQSEKNCQRRLVVGVSGGEDSMALLDILSSLRDELSLELIVAHIDHRLRAESGADAKFVAERSREYNLDCQLFVAAEKEQGENLESWARRIRYGFLEQCRKEKQASFVLTAHHLNDDAETFLFRILSGRAQTSAHTIDACSQSRRLLRPFLEIPKAEISSYVKRHRLRFVNDVTNNDLLRTRNRIRTELLPHLIENYNPNLIETLAECANRLAADEDYLWQEARLLQSGGLGDEAEQIALLSESLGWRVLRLMAQAQVGEVAQKLGYRMLLSLYESLRERTHRNGKVDIGFNIQFEISNSGKISFSMRGNGRKLTVRDSLHIFEVSQAS